MANNSPTIVAASLSDDQLKKSIDSLVTHVDEAMKKMVQSTNNAVGEMEAKLKSLGNLKIDSNGTADGGSSKRAKAQNAETDAIEKTITARGKQIKQNQEAAMSFDQIAAALDKARQTVRDFNIGRQGGLPSTDDYKRYEQALARIVEYNDKLKQSALTRADANQWANAFDAKRAISDVTAVDSRLQQLNKFYADLEKQSDRHRVAVNKQLEDEVGRRSMTMEQMRAFYQEQERLSKEAAKIQNKDFREAFRGALSMPANNVDEVRAKMERLKALLDEMRDKKDKGLISISESDLNRVSNSIARLNQQIDKDAQKRLAAIEKESAAQKKMIDDQYKLSFARTMKIPTDQLDLAQAKLERLQALLRDMRERGILSNTQIASTEAEIRKLEQIIGQVNTAQQQTTQSAQRYTDEIRKQAAAIRATKEWQEKGHVVIGDINYYDKERANVSKRDKQLLLSLEEQIVQAQQKEAQEALVAAEAKRQQAQAAKEAAQASKGVSAYDLGIDPNVSAGRQRQISSTRAASKEIEYLKQQVASLLEVEEREIKTANTASSSYAQLAQYLKNLQSAYQRLGADRIAKGEGTDLAKEIQSTQRAMQKLQQTMSRPISLKDAMGLSEKTLDDIAYKMRQLTSYRSGLNVDTQKKEIQQVNDEYNRLKKRMDEVMQKNQQMIASNTALGRSWNYMKNRLAFYFTVGAGTQFIKNLIEVRSQYEMNERALGILINSAERGTQIFNELSQMALVSPYTLIELSTAAKQLTAYDVAAKDVVDTTRRLADMASAVGIPIERLTYALGQIKAYGYLNSRDARMFANAGIPLVKQLADYYTELEGKLVSTADIYDRIKKKAIGYNDVMSVMYKMTDEGGKFFDFQAKMADTLKVRLANLTLAWNNMLNDMGKESQGVLTWGIGALRELFLQWRTFDKTLKEAAGAFGLYKAIQLIILGLQTATKSTLGLNARLTATGVLGTRLVTIFKALGGAMKSLAANWWLVLVAAAVELSSAIINANEATKEFNKSMREGAESTANDLKKYIEQYKDLRDSLYKTQTQTLPNGKTKSTLVPQDIDKNEASKAWETMREQIELSSAASTDFVSRLLQIENVSDRLREGFKIIDDITQVNAALKDMGDEALVVTQKWSAWWNAWQAPDGLFTNLKEFKVELDEIRQKYGDIANARYVAEHGDVNRATDEQDAIMRAASEAVNDYDREMNRFRVDLDKYTNSLDNFANAMEFSSNPTQVAELYAKAVKQLATQGQLSPQEAFDLQLQIEEARTNAMKLALQSRISDEESALKVAQDERVKESLTASIESNKAQLKLFENSTYEQTAYWNDFTKYIKERHISELSAAYNAMTDNGKKEMDFQSSEWQKYVHKWANSYEKSHNLATDSVFNRIKNWINDANTWSIFIKMTISTEDRKSVYKQLGEYDKAIDEADAQIERLTKRINELNAKKKKSKEETKELADAEEELTQAQKDKADAEAKGGHGKKEKKDERAANKAAKQAESELAKALKEELSTIDKVRSIYKDLTKEGMSHANAVERATRGWDETVNAINRVLQKNGLQKLDLSKFAGIENPRELVNILQSQLNTLLKRGAKPAEIKELQTKVNSLEVDADKYDLTKITKGLNNELGKLKDEYELAVELDANPEMGNMFTEMFGINTTDFPRTIGDYMNRVQQEFDDARKGLQLTAPLNIFKASPEQWYKWGEAVGYSKEQVDDFKKSFDGSIGVVKKWAQDVVKQTQDLQYKLADNNGKISIEEEKLAVLRQRLAKETNDKQKALLELQIQDQENAINKLKEEILQLLPTYQRLFGEVAEHSAWMTRKLAKDYKNMLIEGKNRGLNPDNTYSVRDPITGQIARITKERMGKEIKNADKELQKTQSSIKKITEAFKKGEDGVVDWVHGIELIGQELGKLGQFVDVVGNIVDAFGNPNEYNATAEAIHDIATSLQGVDTAAQGIGQIASGDYIGGAVSVASGLFSAISSWFDNSDKKIVAKIKDSEREVKRLENSYKNLEYAIEQAYGMAEYGARRAAVANRQLQLVELQRQLRLEQSRDSKHRDEDRILELKGQIVDLRNEISQSVDDITNDLLGISSIGDAAEQLVSSMIEAFKQGEDYMLQYDESFEKMIDNMIMKAIVSRVVGDRIEQMWNQVKAVAEQRGAGDQKRIEELTKKLSDAQDEAMNAQSSYEQSLNGGWAQFLTAERKQRLDTANKELERIKAQLAQAEKDYAKAIEPTKDDVDNMREMAAGWREDVKNEFEYWMGAFGIGFGEGADNKQLSSLQQGIQSITEVTAQSLEAYANSISQQAYLRNDLLTQIRDAVVGFDIDVQTASLGQILLQLQASYQVQMSIQGILEGVLVPSGRAFSVELVS